MQFRTPQKCGWALLGLAFGLGVLVGSRLGTASWPNTAFALQPSATPAPAARHWLSNAPSEERKQLEQHLRGLDVAMLEIGHRFSELHFAGLDRNWAYAQYQIEKIELSLQLALERRPKRAASAESFMTESIPFVKQAIASATDSNESAGYLAAMERLRADCMKCHVAENVPHFTVYFPGNRTSSIRAEGARP